MSEAIGRISSRSGDGGIGHAGSLPLIRGNRSERRGGGVVCRRLDKIHLSRADRAAKDAAGEKCQEGLHARVLLKMEKWTGDGDHSALVLSARLPSPPAPAAMALTPVSVAGGVAWPVKMPLESTFLPQPTTVPSDLSAKQ